MPIISPFEKLTIILKLQNFILPNSNYEVVFTAVTYIDIISLHLRAPNDFSAGNPKNNKSKITMCAQCGTKTNGRL